MKKILMLFLLSLWIPIVSFSQTTYPKILKDSLVVITPTQLKRTNLIFLEHSKLKNQALIKDSIISNYELILKNDSLIDSKRVIEINNCVDEIKNNQKVISDLNSKLNKSKRKSKRLKIVTIVMTILGIAGISSIFIK